MHDYRGLKEVIKDTENSVIRLSNKQTKKREEIEELQKQLTLLETDMQVLATKKNETIARLTSYRHDLTRMEQTAEVAKFRELKAKYPNGGEKVDYLTAREIVKQGGRIVCQEDKTDQTFADSWYTVTYYIKNHKLYREFFVSDDRGREKDDVFSDNIEAMIDTLISNPTSIYAVYIY